MSTSEKSPPIKRRKVIVCPSDKLHGKESSPELCHTSFGPLNKLERKFDSSRMPAENRKMLCELTKLVPTLSIAGSFALSMFTLPKWHAHDIDIWLGGFKDTFCLTDSDDGSDSKKSVKKFLVDLFEICGKLWEPEIISPYVIKLVYRAQTLEQKSVSSRVLRMDLIFCAASEGIALFDLSIPRVELTIPISVLENPKSCDPCTFHIHDSILRDIGANECRYPKLSDCNDEEWDGKDGNRITDAYRYHFNKVPTSAIIDAYNHQSFKTWERVEKYKQRGFKMIQVDDKHLLNKALFNSDLGYDEKYPFHQNAPFNPENKKKHLDIVRNHLENDTYDALLVELVKAIKRRMKKHEESFVGEEDKPQETEVPKLDAEAGLLGVIMKYFPQTCAEECLYFEDIFPNIGIREEETPEMYLAYMQKHATGRND
jgi:hypothetical protein